MEKPVIISVRGTQQSNPEEKEDVMELVTQGVLSGSQEEGYVLSYQESELTGLEGTTTTFLVGNLLPAIGIAVMAAFRPI